MAINKQKKIEIVDKLTKAVKDAASFVFVNFHGLTVTESTKLRKELKSKNIGYVVSKKTLLKRALDTIKAEGEMPSLDGEVALVYLPAGQAGGNDPIEPAREINAFQKDHKEQIRILGGIFEGKFMDAAAMTEIATIPPKEVLIAQFVNLINSPIACFAVALGQVAEKKEAAS